MTRMVLFVGIGLLLTVGTVWAGPLEDATAANKRGDYATALKTFQSLAAQGNAEAQNNLGELHAKGQARRRIMRKRVSGTRKLRRRGMRLHRTTSRNCILQV